MNDLVIIQSLANMLERHNMTHWKIQVGYAVAAHLGLTNDTSVTATDGRRYRVVVGPEPSNVNIIPENYRQPLPMAGAKS